MPQTPRGQKINLDEWTLTWSDEFDGNSLDTTKWKSPYGNIARRGGYWDTDQIIVEDGVLKIRTEYKENGRLGSEDGIPVQLKPEIYLSKNMAILSAAASAGGASVYGPLSGPLVTECLPSQTEAPPTGVK
jgi:hypothetical protein